MVYLKNIFHFLIAWASSIVYRFPSRKLFVLGVTGTKGKSTVLELISTILEAAGKKTALISSVRVKYGDESEKNSTSMTMPGRGYLQKFLRRVVGAGCDYALIEVTSQGVLQSRHRFIDFDAALVTNLHAEHIEAHGSFENYRAAKVKFFKDMGSSWKARKYFFINDSISGKELFEKAANGYGKVAFFSREDFIHEDLSKRYSLDSDKAKKLISGWLQNDFNLENVAAAVAFAKSQAISWDTIFKALENFRGVPGRMEYVIREPFAVVIDYAHTPDSLSAVYKTLSEAGKKRLVCVLGAAGGGRDKWKRPEMGKIAADYCAEIILTNEDPYDEPPLSILEEIEKGIWKERNNTNLKVNYEKILDRSAAIRKAIALAEKNDVVILTGKGSEPFLHLERGKQIPWSERKVVEQALTSKKS